MTARVLVPVHRLFNDERLRSALLRLRFPLTLLAAAGLLALVDPLWAPCGLAVSAFGAAGQLWCFGCILTGKRLARNGPYAFVRNPMYLARYLLLAGLLLATGRLWLVGAFTAIYYFYMVNRVRREERKLRRTFGEEYRAYCTAVPRFLPRLRPAPGARLLFFRWDYFQRNHGLSTLTVLLAYYACVAYVAWLRG